MQQKLHNTQLSVKRLVAVRLNDGGLSPWHSLQMLLTRIDPMESLPPRRHFIPEWAMKSGLRRADVARATGADKATVTRWFRGTAPQDQYLMTLAKLFNVSVPDLFRHPDDVWVSRFLEGRSETEIERIKKTLEAAFPRGVAS